MSFKEQFQTKNYNEEELLKGYVNNLTYIEYLYYLASLADYFNNKKKYKRALYFYDHLLKSAGCAVLLKKYDELGKKVPNELKIYTTSLDEITQDPLMDVLGKKIDKIATKHTTRKFFFQMIMLIVGVGIGFLSHLVFGASQDIALIIGLCIAAFIPLFYKPNPITLEKSIDLEKNLAYVCRHNKALLDFVQKHIKSEQALDAQKELKEKKQNKESIE